jgi:hypothetical protein
MRPSIFLKQASRLRLQLSPAQLEDGAAMWHGLVIVCAFGVLAAGLYMLVLALVGEGHSRWFAAVSAFLISTGAMWIIWGTSGGHSRPTDHE